MEIRREPTQARACATWKSEEARPERDRPLDCERRPAHLQSRLANKQPTGSPLIRGRIPNQRPLTHRLRAVKHRSELRDELAEERNALGSKKLLLRRLRKRHSKIMMVMVAVPRRIVVVIAVMLAMRRFIGVKTERFPTVLRGHMHADTEPSEQRQSRDELMDEFHKGGFCTGIIGESRHSSTERSVYFALVTTLCLMWTASSFTTRQPSRKKL